MFWINEQFDAASNPGFPSDEPCWFERSYHLVNRRWGPGSGCSFIIDDNRKKSTGCAQSTCCMRKVKLPIKLADHLHKLKAFRSRTPRPCVLAATNATRCLASSDLNRRSRYFPALTTHQGINVVKSARLPRSARAVLMVASFSETAPVDPSALAQPGRRSQFSIVSSLTRENSRSLSVASV